MSLQLGALAPITLLLDLVETDYRIAQSWSSLLFAVASCNAWRVLARGYEPLVAVSPLHAQLRRVWILLYAFVGIQMGWDLRPFVGNPELEAAFFRSEIGNAYVEVPNVLWEALDLKFVY